MNQAGNLTQIQYPISCIRLDGEHLFVGDQTLYIPNRSPAQRRLCKQLNIPVDYYPKLPPELQSPILKHHIDEVIGKGHVLTDATSIIFSRNGQFVGVGRTDLQSLTASQAIDALCQGVGSHADSLQVAQLSLTDESLEPNVISERAAIEVRPRDILDGGRQVRHSLIGAEATTVLTYVRRLIETLASLVTK